nr:reverse transcriptase domain-containing protein [Tanacetum cinerariifolium]
MVPATTSLTGFSGETIWPLGQLRLLVIVGDATHSTKAWMNFLIVKSLSPYNGIIERPGLRAIKAVPSMVHRMLKFPVEGGIVTIRSIILIPTECASIITSSVVPSEERTRPANFKVDLHQDFPDQEVAIGGTLSDKGRTELCSILKKNLDIFAWQPSDMTGVPRSVAEHRLNIREGYSPVRQKKRGQAPKRAKDIQAEVQKLVEAGIMREVYYHDWLSNPVMDCYPLPEIDWKVESLCSYPFKCFLDAHKGYHQIQLAENIEVYVDDLVVKSYTEAEMMRDIEETFRTLRKVNIKLNPKKCSFGLAEGVFLGPRTSVKGHILADFFIEMPGDVSQAVLVAETKKEPWTLFTDGSSCMDGSGAGFILTSPDGIEFTYTLRFQFTTSNNEAEYEALVVGLRIAARIGVKNVQVSVDSKLVANQVLGTYVAKEDNMVKYLEIVKSLVSRFTTFSISQVSRSKNKKPDALSKNASTSFMHLSKQVLVEVLKDKSIKEKKVTTVIQEDGPTWMTQLVDYLKGGVLIEDKKEARKLHLKARQYELIEGVLYSMHAGPRSVVAKAIWLGYYWPTMQKDARDMIRKCNDCQGIDIAGPFSKGPWKVKFLIVAMDYFTKWIEAKAVATITGGQRFASVKHPQSNGLIEKANQSLGEEIKSRLGEGNKNWVEELLHVLSAHRTMIKSSHGDTPFSLTYGTEAVIPTEIGMPTYRTAVVDVVSNDEELRLNLDLLEERRERAAIREAKAKSKMTRYYNARVRSVTFKPGDFVYRSNDASHAVAGGKLGLKWEGPYEVTEALGNRAYKL